MGIKKIKPIILITGANGMLAKYLTKQLEGEYFIRFLTRKVTKSNEYLWNIKTKYIDQNALKDVHTIIHLAGSSIANKRWTKKRKRLILSSRVDSANLILEELKKHQITINSFISASAIGYYGTSTTSSIYNEESLKGKDFLSDVCNKWEDAAHAFKSTNVAHRVIILRLGIILDKNEGALEKIVSPVKYGFGSGLGSGKQYMPWIHIQDLCNLFQYVITNNQLSGTFNAVSPQHITNIELTRGIAKVLKRFIILPNVPKFIIKVLFGEKSSILLNGSRISSEKIVNAGFKFEYPDINEALSNILRSKR